ncbi:glycosyltransferase family 2 protein [Polynucleobacter yangtzensis]|nr:glycosyltransferase family 2 protein [Polynucleobacter yangtzensis]
MSILESTYPKSSLSVAILLATYNGEKYLREQLQSIAAQDMTNWGLFVSDDGSSDATKKILADFADEYADHEVKVFDGPKKGFAQNFLSLVCNPDIGANFFAYADQDDVWMKIKLKKAVQWLESVPSDLPALYCSRTEYVDENLKHIAYSPDYGRPAIFANALVQNIASGNTMVFNAAARQLLQKAGKDADIPLHDWWTYMLVTGAGGVTHFDKSPTVFYRQHSNNLWGMNAGWRASLSRIQKLFEGRFKGWNERHIIALNGVTGLLTADAKKRIDLFSQCRVSSGLVERLMNFEKSGVYRQTFITNLGLRVAILFRKI